LFITAEAIYFDNEVIETGGNGTNGVITGVRRLSPYL
jgi:hypothetical protein